MVKASKAGLRAGLSGFFDKFQLHGVITSVLRYEDQIAKLDKENKALSAKLSSTIRELQLSDGRLQSVCRELETLQEKHCASLDMDTHITALEEELRTVRESSCICQVNSTPVDCKDQAVMATAAGDRTCNLQDEEDVELLGFHHELSILPEVQGYSLLQELSFLEEGPHGGYYSDEGTVSESGRSLVLHTGSERLQSSAVAEMVSVQNEQRLALVEGQLDQAQHRIVQLESHLQTYKDRCNAYEHQVSHHQTTIDELHMRLSEAQSLENTHISTIRKMESQWEKIDSSLKSAQKELSRYKSIHSDNSLHLSQLQERLTNSLSKITEQSDDMVDLRSVVSSLELEITNHEVELTKHKKEFHLYKIDHMHSNKEYTDMEDKLWDLEYEKVELCGKLNARHRHMACSADSVFN